MWCVAELDEEYIRKMENVLAVYEKPYDAAEPVVCLDEKPVSLHADVRPPQAATPGKIAKRENEYDAVAQPMSLVPWNPRPAGTSPNRRPPGRRRSSLK